VIPAAVALTVLLLVVLSAPVANDLTTGSFLRALPLDAGQSVELLATSHPRRLIGLRAGMTMVLPLLVTAVAALDGSAPEVARLLVASLHVGLAVVLVSSVELWAARRDAQAAGGLLAGLLGLAVAWLAVAQVAYAPAAIEGGPAQGFAAVRDLLDALASPSGRRLRDLLTLGAAAGLASGVFTYDRLRPRSPVAPGLVIVTLCVALPGIVLLALGYVPAAAIDEALARRARRQGAP
jgi:hypothetical protein